MLGFAGVHHEHLDVLRPNHLRPALGKRGVIVAIPEPTGARGLVRRVWALHDAREPVHAFVGRTVLYALLPSAGQDFFQRPHSHEHPDAILPEVRNDLANLLWFGCAEQFATDHVPLPSRVANPFLEFPPVIQVRVRTRRQAAERTLGDGGGRTQLEANRVSCDLFLG